MRILWQFLIVKSCHILSVHETWLDWKLGSLISPQNMSMFQYHSSFLEDIQTNILFWSLMALFGPLTSLLLTTGHLLHSWQQKNKPHQQFYCQAQVLVHIQSLISNLKKGKSWWYNTSTPPPITFQNSSNEGYLIFWLQFSFTQSKKTQHWVNVLRSLDSKGPRILGPKVHKWGMVILSLSLDKVHLVTSPFSHHILICLLQFYEEKCIFTKVRKKWQMTFELFPQFIVTNVNSFCDLEIKQIKWDIWH